MGISKITKSLPDTYAYTKRMAEHVLFEHNEQNKKFPLVFLRPAILGASMSEPVPGWTDTMGLLSGFTYAVGMGVLKDCPGNPEYFLDVIPVDTVARQLLVSIPYAVHQARLSGGENRLLVSQVSTSALNPIAVQAFFNHVVEY